MGYISLPKYDLKAAYRSHDASIHIIRGITCHDSVDTDFGAIGY